MLAFFSARYAPGNATLVVAGDVEEARLRELAEQTYGLIPARAFTPQPGEIPIAPPCRASSRRAR